MHGDLVLGPSREILARTATLNPRLALTTPEDSFKER